jgi:myosin V
VLRREYLEFRRGVVLVQSAWRRRRARRELRRLRQEAREATKLLQDKRSLEEKVTELQNVLEVVQNQRNELKQQYKVRDPMTRAPLGKSAGLALF